MPEKLAKVVLTFEGREDLVDKAVDAFWAWFLDGGGDDAFHETCNERDVCIIDSDWDMDKGIIRTYVDIPCECDDD